MKKREVRIFDHQQQPTGLFGMPLRDAPKKHTGIFDTSESEEEMESLIDEAIFDRDPDAYDLDWSDIDGDA